MITTVMLESEQSQHYYVVSSIFASTVKIVYLPVIAVCVCVASCHFVLAFSALTAGWAGSPTVFLLTVLFIYY